MIYTRVADIYKAIDETRERLYKRVEGLNQEQARARRDANAWSATEIVEHLTIMEDRLVRMMKVMLTKAEGASAKSDRATVEIKPFSLDEFVARSRNEKYIAPEAVRPSGTVRLSMLIPATKLMNGRFSSPSTMESTRLLLSSISGTSRQRPTSKFEAPKGRLICFDTTRSGGMDVTEWFRQRVEWR